MMSATSSCVAVGAMWSDVGFTPLVSCIGGLTPNTLLATPHCYDGVSSLNAPGCWKGRSRVGDGFGGGKNGYFAIKKNPSKLKG